MSGNIFSQYTVVFEKDETVYSQADSGTCMYVIKQGEVALFKETPKGQEEVGVLGKGDFFGELSILELSARTETAKALQETTVVIIHRNTFVKMLKANMEIAIRILQKMSTKMRLAEERSDKLYKKLQTEEGESTHFTEPGVVMLPKQESVKGKLISLTTNRTFILDSDRNLVGRYDPVTGIRPEVDLTYEDDNRSVSRRHAVILRKGDQFYVQEEIGVLNGTYVNGAKASNGAEQPINDQDMVNFGMLSFKFFHLKDGEAEVLEQT